MLMVVILTMLSLTLHVLLLIHYNDGADTSQRVDGLQDDSRKVIRHNNRETLKLFSRGMFYTSRNSQKTYYV